MATAEPPQPATPSKPRRKISPSLVLGTLLAVAGVGFVASKISSKWPEVRDRLEHVSAGWLGLGLALAVLGMVAIALAWRPVLIALGAPAVSRATVVRWYFVGEIGKYVPGGIWTVVGRAELSRRGGLPRSAAYGSVALSLLLLELGAACVAAVALPLGGVAHHSGAAWLVVLLLPVGLAVLHPKVLGASLKGIAKVTHREVSLTIPPFATMLRLLAGYVPAWLFIGTGTWAITRSLDPHAPFGTVFAAAIVSWIVGFLLVPVPGGVGVREGAFTALVVLPGGVAAASALLARVAFMLVDGAGAIITPIVLRSSKSVEAPPAAAAAPRVT